MPLVNVTPIVDNSLADAPDINVPIAAILAVLNGGIDASNLADGGVTNAKLEASIRPETRTDETTADFVSFGLAIGVSATLYQTTIAGTAYINGKRIVVASTGNSYAASKDTYVDLDVNGLYTYNAVANGAASPTLAANSLRLAKVITSGTAITSVVQQGSDTLGNLLYSRGSASTQNLAIPYKFLAYRATTSQTIPSSVFTKIQFNAEVYDSGNNFDANTNYRFTCPVDGYYDFQAQIVTSSAVQRALISLYKNGAEYMRGGDTDTNTATNGAGYRGITLATPPIPCLASDYFELCLYTTSASGVQFGTAPYTSWFGGTLSSLS